MGAFQGVGAIAGGLTAARMLKKVGELRLAGIGLALFAFGDVCWLVPRLAVILPTIALAGLGIVWAIVALATAYQRRSPSEVQGRVAAAANMLFSVPQTLSIAVGAALITLIDYRIEIVAMFIVFLLSAGYLLTRRDDDAVEVEVRVEPALAA
jgi:MFS family permease